MDTEAGRFYDTSYRQTSYGEAPVSWHYYTDASGVTHHVQVRHNESWGGHPETISSYTTGGTYSWNDDEEERRRKEAEWWRQHWRKEEEDARKLKEKHEHEERQRKATEYLNKGIESHNQSKYSDAIWYFNKGLEYDTSNWLLYNWRGWAQNNCGVYNDALINFEYALQFPKGHDASNFHGRGFAREKQLGDDKGALLDYEYALKLDPKREEARNDYNRLVAKPKLAAANRFLENGHAAYNRGDYNEAIGYYNQGVAALGGTSTRDPWTDPTKALLCYWRGMAQLKVELFSSARSNFTSAIELVNGRDAEDYYARGQAYEGLSDFENALDDYKHARRLNSGLSGVNTACDRVHNIIERKKQREREEAEERERQRLARIREQNLRHKRNFDEAFEVCEQAYLNSSRDKTIQTTTQALKIAENPPNGTNPEIDRSKIIQCYLFLAHAYYRLDSFSEAENNYLRITGLFTEEFDIFLRLGISQFKLAKYSKAKTNLKKALALEQSESPSSSKLDEGHRYLAEAMLKLDDNPDSIIRELKLIRDTNSNTKALLSTAYEKGADVLWEQRKYSKAATYYTSALEQQSTARVLRRCGWAHFNANQYDSAKSHFKRAIKKYNTGEDHYGLGRVYEDLKSYEKARLQYQEAKELSPSTKKYSEAHSRAVMKITQQRQKEDFDQAFKKCLDAFRAKNYVQTIDLANEIVRTLPNPQNPLIERVQIDEVYQRRGESYYRLNQFIHAEQDFVRAEKSFAHDSVYHQQLGIARFHRRKYQESIESLRKAVATKNNLDDLGHDVALKYMARAMLELEQDPDAILAELQNVRKSDNETEELRKSTATRKIRLVLNPTEDLLDEAAEANQHGYICLYENTLGRIATIYHQANELINQFNLQNHEIGLYIERHINKLAAKRQHFASKLPAQFRIETFLACEEYLSDIRHGRYSAKRITARNISEMYFLLAILDLRYVQDHSKASSRKKLAHSLYINRAKVKARQINWIRLLKTKKLYAQLIQRSHNDNYWRANIPKHGYQTFAVINDDVATYRTILAWLRRKHIKYSAKYASPRPPEQTHRNEALEDLLPNPDAVINCPTENELYRTAAQLIILKSEHDRRNVIPEDIEPRLRLNNDAVHISGFFSRQKINKCRVEYELDRQFADHDSLFYDLLNYELIRFNKEPMLDPDEIRKHFVLTAVEIGLLKALYMTNPLTSPETRPLPSVSLGYFI